MGSYWTGFSALDNGFDSYSHMPLDKPNGPKCISYIQFKQARDVWAE